ncbi:GNAT family N-acetyltransferase, partial [Klebsiella pneumoniae]|nr:GNAT family N-acetyltransferase [Klebsiella pneumoniae]
MTAFTLRPTRIDDVAALPAIERAAGQRFRDVPELAWLADNEVISVEDHLGYA